MSAAAVTVASPWQQRPLAALRFGYPMLVVGLVGVLSWEGAVRLLQIPTYILPAPSGILEALWTSRSDILSASRITGLAVVGGMALGAVVGSVVAFVISLFDRTATTVLGLLAFLSCAPIVALAPIFNAWFGATNLMSKIAVAAIMVFFPVVVNATRGLIRVDPLHREVMQSVSASRRQLMFMVRIPGAVPGFFDGLKIGSTLSVIGIIVSEYFGGSSNALGVYIANTAAVSQFSRTWAAVAAASLLGLAIYGLVLLVERLVAPWRHQSVST